MRAYASVFENNSWVIFFVFGLLCASLENITKQKKKKARKNKAAHTYIHTHTHVNEMINIF